MHLSAAVDMADMLGEKSFYGEKELERHGFSTEDYERGIAALEKISSYGKKKDQ